MTTTRNYLDEDYSPDAVLILGANSAHHLVKVLRKKEGDEIEIFDGRGASCLAKILSIKSSEVTILVTGKISFSGRQGISINLGQALIKPEPFNFSIQKATELGVDLITPLITERSSARLHKESYDKKRQKWQVIAQGACEQCGQNWLPKINDLESPQEKWRSSIVQSIQDISGDTIIFSHFMVINCVVGWINNFDNLVGFYPDNCSITKIIKRNGELELTQLGNELSTVIQ